MIAATTTTGTMAVSELQAPGADEAIQTGVQAVVKQLLKHLLASSVSALPCGVRYRSHHVCLALIGLDMSLVICSGLPRHNQC